jgi:hypothetical protein
VKDCTHRLRPHELILTFTKVTDVFWRCAFAEGNVNVDLDLGCRWRKACWSDSASAWANVRDEVSAAAEQVSQLANLCTNAVPLRVSGLGSRFVAIFDMSHFVLSFRMGYEFIIKTLVFLGFVNSLKGGQPNLQG